MVWRSEIIPCNPQHTPVIAVSERNTQRIGCLTCLNRSRRPCASGTKSLGEVMAIAIALAVSQGCRRPPPAVSTNEQLEPGERGYDRVLDESDRQEVMESLARAAKAEQANTGQRDGGGERASSIGRGLRWSDVSLAAATACDEPGVELAIVSVDSSPDHQHFVLVSVDNRPAELIITRTHDARVYEATARVGWQGSETSRAAALLEAFDRAMNAFGRKRGFIDD